MQTPNQLKTQLLQLMEEKTDLEKAIKELGEVLETNDNIGMNGPLIDAEGFPRNDIDVYQVRLARQQIICKQNDHKALMSKIEPLLHQLHNHPESRTAFLAQESARNNENSNTINGAAVEIGVPVSTNVNGFGVIKPLEEELTSGTPFIEVDIVTPRSPSYEAGIRVGDKILEFGPINSTNYTNNLHQIGEYVGKMENKKITIILQREEQLLKVELTPKRWIGNGLLGCNIIPI